MKVFLIVSGGVVGGLVVLALILRVVFGSLRAKPAAIIAQRFKPDDLRRQTLNACFFGRESAGMKQVRGNGALVLTGDRLWFLMALPRRETSIPLDHVTKVSLVRSHCGKTLIKPLLRVEFVDGDACDAIAWAVPDPEAWRHAIEDIRSLNDDMAS